MQERRWQVTINQNRLFAENFWTGEVLCPLPTLLALPAALQRTQGRLQSTPRPSMVEPRWTNIIGNQESGVDGERFQWVSTTLRESWARCQRRSAPIAHEFAGSKVGAIASALRRMLHAN